MSRPTLLADPAIRATFLKAVEGGATYADAALLAGIGPDVISKWQRKGAASPRSIYGKFVRDLENARAKRREAFRKVITALAVKKNDWRGPAYIASITEPEHFAQRVHIVVEEQLRTAIVRLKAEFNDPAEHEILERALAAIVGEDGEGGIDEAPGAASIRIGAGGVIEAD